VSTAELVALLAAVFIASVVQVTAGFGFALLAVPVMAAAVDPKVAVVVSTGLGLFSSTGQALVERAHLRWPIARRLLLAAFVGMPVGLLVFMAIDESMLRLALGVAVLAATVALARGVDLREAGPGVEWAAGVTSGVLATSLSTNGPPLVFSLQGRHLPPHEFRATISVVFAGSGVLALLGFALAGQITDDVLTGVLLSLPVLVLGGLIGLWARRHVTAERFRHLVLVLLSLAGLSAIVAAVRG
jgi:hypothetical protein